MARSESSPTGGVAALVGPMRALAVTPPSAAAAAEGTPRTTAEQLVECMLAPSLEAAAEQHEELLELRRTPMKGKKKPEREAHKAQIKELTERIGSLCDGVLAALARLEALPVEPAAKAPPTDEEVVALGKIIQHPLIWELGAPLQVLRHYWDHRHEGVPVALVQRALTAANAYEGAVDGAAICRHLEEGLGLPEGCSVALQRKLGPFRGSAPAWMGNSTDGPYADIVQEVEEMPEGHALVGLTLEFRGLDVSGTTRAALAPLEHAVALKRRPDDARAVPELLADPATPGLEFFEGDKTVFSAWFRAKERAAGGGAGGGAGAELALRRGAVFRLGTMFASSSEGSGQALNPFALAKEARTRHAANGEKLCEIAHKLVAGARRWRESGLAYVLVRDA